MSIFAVAAPQRILMVRHQISEFRHAPPEPPAPATFASECEICKGAKSIVAKRQWGPFFPDTP